MRFGGQPCVFLADIVWVYLNRESRVTLPAPAGWAAVKLWQKGQAQFNPAVWSLREYELENETGNVNWSPESMGLYFCNRVVKKWDFLGVKTGRSCVWVILPVCAVHHCKGLLIRTRAGWDRLPAFQRRRYSLSLHILKHFFPNVSKHTGVLCKHWQAPSAWHGYEGLSHIS